MDFTHLNDATFDLNDHVVLRVPALWIDDESGSIEDRCSLSTALQALQPIDVVSVS